MVVAQLVEWSLQTPVVRGSNPVIGKIYIERFSVYCMKFGKTKIKEKEAWNGPFKSVFLVIIWESLYF